jgi:hypothetical protein
LRKKLALLLAAVLMTVPMVAAAPAFADGQSDAAPECEGGQLSASEAQDANNSTNDDPDAHFFMSLACNGGQVPSSEHPSP